MYGLLGDRAAEISTLREEFEMFGKQLFSTETDISIQAQLDRMSDMARLADLLRKASGIDSRDRREEVCCSDDTLLFPVYP